MKIAILGAGAYGKALAKILTDNQHEITFYDPALYPDVNLEAAAYQADAVVITIPSMYLADFITDYPHHLKKVPTILASKGMMSIDMFSDFAQFSVISGPGFAEEIIEGKPTTLTASNPFAMGIFRNAQVTVELCDDLAGIVMCGALKNIYAIGAGFYSNSENMSATFMQHAHAEMQRYLEDHGAKAATAELACGLGDLILTCTNDTSRNYRCGVRLREGKTITEITAELKTIEGLSALLSADTEPYKLLREIRELVANHSK